MKLLFGRVPQVDSASRYRALPPGVRWAAVSVLAGAGVLSCSITALYWDTREAPDCGGEVGIILGNQVYPDGTPSPRLAARLDAGLQLYRAGRVKQLLVSGGIGKEQRDEGVVMGAYLERAGVPPEAIMVDSQGVTTHATSINASQLLPPTTTVVAISQRYHVSRAKLSLRHAGFQNVCGYYPDYHEWRDLYSVPREVPAWLQYWLLNK